jgi:hypothetical protein
MVAEASFPIVTTVISLPKNGQFKEVFIYHHITSRGRGVRHVAPRGGVPVQCLAVLVRAVVSYAARNPALCLPSNHFLYDSCWAVVLPSSLVFALLSKGGDMLNFPAFFLREVLC